MFALLAALTLSPPVIPDSDPLASYAHYMVDITEQHQRITKRNNQILWIMVGLNVAALGAGAVVFRRIWKAREADMAQVLADREQAIKDREQAAHDREVSAAVKADLMKVLELIKGWSIVSADTNKKVESTLAQQSNEVKQKIDEVGAKIEAVPPKVDEELHKHGPASV